MGTRADFYVGRGKESEWLGSIAWDGYPDGIPDDVKLADTEDLYRTRVEEFFADGRSDVSRPADGWPWPWETSHTTDYAYAFDGGKVWASSFGHPWWPAADEQPDNDGGPRGKVIFPDMRAIQKTVLSGKRSGLIVITSSGIE